MFEWQSLIRPTYFVPETKKIDDLLKEFQEKKMHMAIVVDEYGGSSGIVTLEDVIEEIVGEINDEFDDDEIVYSRLDDDNYVFEGKTSLINMCRIIDIEYSDIEPYAADADTIAGLLLELNGTLPEKEQIINCEKLRFKVESVDKRRIKRVKVTKQHEIINEQE
jgi:CBS domain containing-hemolysin-like protein